MKEEGGGEGGELTCKAVESDSAPVASKSLWLRSSLDREHFGS